MYIYSKSNICKKIKCLMIENKGSSIKESCNAAVDIKSLVNKWSISKYTNYFTKGMKRPIIYLIFSMCIRP